MHGQFLAFINILYLCLPDGIYLNDLFFLCTDCNNLSWYDILWEYPQHTTLRQQVGIWWTVICTMLWCYRNRNYAMTWNYTSFNSTIIPSGFCIDRNCLYQCCKFLCLLSVVLSDSLVFLLSSLSPTLFPSSLPPSAPLCARVAAAAV